MEKKHESGDLQTGIIRRLHFCTSEIWEFFFSIETDEDRGTHFQVVNFEWYHLTLP